MAFSSVQFLFVFLPLSLAVYWLCPKWLRNAVLAAFSLLFFAWAGLKGAAILVLLAGINWLGGLSLGRLAHKRPLLILLILLDLAVLGGFKYAGFAAETVNALVPGLLPVLSPALPLGLSFYVFTAIGYCADVAAGKVESEKNPIRFAVFLAFFGHGPSGPIVRYGQQAPQLDPGSETRRVSADRFCYGIKRLVLGLAKKAIIADQLALIYAKAASVPAATLPAPILVLGYTAYMMQLYFDFSGYSDMAVGLGQIFGFHFPENFRYPFLSGSVTEFWRRWHISLGSWFRDYVYIPLGGSRCSRSRWLLNVFLVWGLTGLWHGAAWNFVLWGLFFAVLLAAEKLWYGHGLEKTRLLKHLYMLPLLAVSFVLFNAADLPAAGQQIAALFGFGGLPAAGVESLYYLRSYAVVLVIALLGATPLPAKAVQRLRDTSAGSAVLSVAEPVALVLLLALCTAYLVDGSFNPFLYFRF